MDGVEEDMRDFALDDAGDILLEADDIALCEGTAQEIQKIRQPFGGRREARTGGACGQFVLLLRRWRRTERCL